jgi:hypothetical protein
MFKRVLFWSTTTLAAVVFASMMFAAPAGAVAKQPAPTPTPTEMPSMEMGGMTMPGAGEPVTGTVTDTVTETVKGTDASDAGHDMAGHAMGSVSSAGVPPAAAMTGAQPLDYVLEGDTKVFTLTAEVVEWPITEGVTMTAYTYNGMVPGPLLRVISCRRRPPFTGTGSWCRTAWTAWQV